MATHAPFSPSSSFRWLKCQKSVEYTDLPEGKMYAASQGTAKHFLAEQCIETGYDCKDPDVMFYVNYVRKLQQGVRTEKKLEIIPGKCWGTADAVGLNKSDVLEVIDFKYGKNPVAVIGNTQLLCYAVGVVNTYCLSRGEIKLVIVQPRSKGKNKISKWVVSVPEVIRFREKLERVVNYPSPTGVPGDWCYFCKGKTLCQEYLLNE